MQIYDMVSRRMFSQISHIPDLVRKFCAKKCGLYAGVYGSWEIEEATSHKAGSSAFFNIVFEREGKKEKLLQHRVFVFGHPSRYDLCRTGLNFIERTRRGAVLVV